jgi:hypothetical protein
MKIAINTKKFIRHNQKHRQVLSIEAFQVNQLLDEYFEQYPHCSLSEDSQLLYIAKNINVALCCSVGDIHSERSFQEMVRLIEKCAKQLKRINNSWKGEEIILI